VNNRSRVSRLFQWLSRRAKISRSDSAIGGLSRIVRTEVTFERRESTLLVGGASADLKQFLSCCDPSESSARPPLVEGRVDLNVAASGHGDSGNAMDRCPLCGQKFTLPQAEQPRLLEADSTIQPTLPADRDPP
jgi:hypothetical protein